MSAESAKAGCVNFDNTGSAVLLDEILEPLSLCMDDQRIASLRLAPEIDDRVEYLAECANEGLLSA